MSDMDAVTVRGLVKSYDGRRVVDGLDLDVRAGEIVGLIGANGAGKTTTVECIQGLRRPDAGTLRVFGLDTVTQADRLRGVIGSQLQSAALPDRLRVREAVRLFSGGDGDDLLQQFGLAERGRAPFATLSGGERQRLFLVLALVNHPRLVILDELTQGLDPAARRDVWSAVGQLRAVGTTVLLVTHELDDAEELCDRVVAMRAGRILATGTPAQLVDRYGHSATITFTAPAGLEIGCFDHLPGVVRVECENAKVTVTGGRGAIAHVGAALVAGHWAPPDLSVRIPTLEQALIDLIEQDTAEPPSPAPTPQLTGARP
jgi:ABC-2 type transport system ATP-binding protein